MVLLQAEILIVLRLLLILPDPWIRLNKNSFCQLGYGACQQRIQATVTSKTSNIAVEIAGDKEDTKYLLQQAAINVPEGESIRDLEELKVAVKQLGFPLAVKPTDGNHGRVYPFFSINCRLIVFNSILVSTFSCL